MYSDARWGSTSMEVDELWTQALSNQNLQRGVPLPDPNQRCYSEMSEIIPGLYVGPESAVHSPRQMTPFGIQLVLMLNGAEDTQEIWSPIAEGMTVGAGEECVIVDDGTRFVHREDVSPDVFAKELRLAMESAHQWFKGGCVGARPPDSRAIFRRTIPADDNQLYDISVHFHELVHLIELVMRYRKWIEDMYPPRFDSLRDQSPSCQPLECEGLGKGVGRAWRPRSGLGGLSVVGRGLGEQPPSLRCTTTITTRVTGGSVPPSVAVHCLVGMSRSVTIVVAYLMKVTRQSPKVVLDDLVRVRRPIAQPNPGFISHLHRWEQCCYSIPKDLASSNALAESILTLGTEGTSCELQGLVAEQLVAVRSLLRVYIVGARFSVERGEMGRVLWDVAGCGGTSHEFMVVRGSQLFEEMFGLIYQSVRDGVYEDSPELFNAVRQFIDGLVRHSPDANTIRGCAEMYMASTGFRSLLSTYRECDPSRPEEGIVAHMKKQWADVERKTDPDGAGVLGMILFVVVGLGTHVRMDAIDLALERTAAQDGLSSRMKDDVGLTDDVAWAQTPINRFLKAFEY